MVTDPGENPTPGQNTETTVGAVRPWSFWATVGFSLAIGAVFVIAQVLVAAVFAITHLVSTDNFDLLAFSDALIDGELFSFSILASSLAGLGMIMLFVKLRHGISISQYLGLRKISFRTVALVMVVAAALLGISALMTSALEQPDTSDLFSRAYATSQLPALFWFAVVIIGPLFEEAFLRGFVFTGFLSSRAGTAGTVLLTAFIWTTLHGFQYGWYELATILVLGIGLGVVRWRTGSMWATLLIHSIWNLAAMVEMVIRT